MEPNRLLFVSSVFCFVGTLDRCIALLLLAKACDIKQPQGVLHCDFCHACDSKERLEYLLRLSAAVVQLV